MAHWCFNKLEIEGDEEDVNAAVARMRGSYSDGSECLFAFDRVLPPPPDVASLGIDWHYDNWGTDRYPIQCRVMSVGAQYALEFSTASGPANGAVAALASQHPDLRFVHFYDFADYGFGGELTYEDGQLVNEHYWDEDEDEGDGDGVEESEASAVTTPALEGDAPPPRAPVRSRPSALAEGDTASPA